MILVDLLRQYGATEKHLGKGEHLFMEGEAASYYYEVLEGEVKMNNYSEEGKEFIQGIFSGEVLGSHPCLQKPSIPLMPWLQRRVQ